MENNTKGIGTQDKGKLGIIIGILILVVAIAVFGVFVFTNNKKDNEKEEEQKQVAAFTAEMEEVFAQAKEQCPANDFTCAQTAMSSGITQAARNAGGGDSVMALANVALADVMAMDKDSFGSAGDMIQDVAGTLMGNASDLVNGVIEGVGSLIGGGDNGSDIKKTVTLASKTVCAESGKGRIDSKFCLDGNSEKLSANVYVTNPTSENWAVVIHPFMLNGSLIYSSLGNMYTEKGYNVITPDLRGFGNSDGAVAMGYLESLDVYDWIQDLNDNYDKKYGVKVKPETIVVHGVSLGGATTLQLATNPDIAGKTSDVYTRTLTDLNVKGFVDDCGYTSMTGIITGMLSLGEMPDLAGLLGSLGIDLETFTSEFKNIASELGLGNLFGSSGMMPGMGGTSTPGMGSIMQGISGMTDITAGIEEILKYAMGGTTTIPGMDQNSMDILNSFMTGQIPDSLTGMIPGDMMSIITQAMQGGFSVPGMGGSTIPGMGGSTIPGMGGTTTPGMGGTTTPGNGGTTTPGNGGTTTPGNGGTTTPGNAGSIIPDLGDLNIPGMGGQGSTGYDNPLFGIFEEMMGGMTFPGMGGEGNIGTGTGLFPGMGGTTTPGNGGPTFPGTTGTGWPFKSVGASPLDGLSGLLEGIVSKALINIIGVGLTEDNYAVYSNSFANGRNFPTNSKVMVIHGTNDTMVPHSNADTVANNVNPGILVNKWDVEGQPHAFIIMGTKKDEYKTTVSKYIECLNDANCKTLAK